jgi:sec-independent protein translocase protein TatC
MPRWGEMKSEPQDVNPQAEMTIFEHLDELRRRLVYSIIALVVGMIGGMFFTVPFLRLLISPLGAEGEAFSTKLQVIGVTEAPSVFFKVSLLLGAIVAMPVIVYQIFMYARPGLEPRERRYVLLGVPAASISFAGGVVFCALVLLPSATNFLQGFLSEVVEHRWTLEKYVQFTGNILLWAGLVFETPLVMYFLALLGIVDHNGYAKVRRLVIVGAAVLAAIVTPTVDPVNMLLVMGPFLLLYEVGILLARLAQRQRSRSTAAEAD